MDFSIDEMKSFVDYLVSNWEVNGCVSIEKKFAHSRKVGIDKKSERERINHIVNVGLRFFDKDNKLLKSESVKFENNLLCAASKKKLINISDEELNNRFMSAKSEILGIIRYGYDQKMMEIDSKMNELMSYADNDSVVIPAEFKGEHIELSDKKVKVKKNKAVFDM